MDLHTFEMKMVDHHLNAPMTWVDAPTFYPQTHTKGHDKHHIEHAKEMGVTFKEWLNEAAELLNSRDNGTIKWQCKGKYYGLDKQNNKIAVGNKDGGIYTYFILAKNKMRYYIPDEVVAYHHLKPKGVFYYVGGKMPGMFQRQTRDFLYM